MPYLDRELASFDSPVSSAQPDAFHRLVQKLSEALGPSLGLGDDDVPMVTQKLMEEYTSEEEEWAQYAFHDASRNYTRNLVDEGNGKSNLLVLIWTPGKGSPIHDHANAHCVMKILKGSLRETLYEMPKEGKEETGASPLHITSKKVFTENQVTYISDKIGLHKIENAAPNDVAVSLHLYTPPNAAIDGFHLFDEKTGKSSHVKCADVYSKRGLKV